MLKTYFEIDDTFFRSEIYGDKTYHWLKKEVAVIEDISKSSPIVTDDLGNRYYIRIMPSRFIYGVSNARRIYSYLKAIVRLKHPSFYNLPTDIIQISKDNLDMIEACDFLLENDYSEEKHACEAFYAFLYPVSTTWDLPTLADTVEQLKVHYQSEGLSAVCWKKKLILNLASNLAQALGKLNEAGYCYLDFNRKKIFVKSDYSVLLDFSLLTVPINTGSITGARELPLEYRHIKNWAMPFHQYSNYSLTAFLFHLLFGKFPYESSSNIIIEDDSNIFRYQEAFGKYYENSTFVFADEVLAENIIYTQDKQALQHWKDAPEKLRFIFSEVLSSEYYSGPFASEWVTYLKEFYSEVKDD